MSERNETNRPRAWVGCLACYNAGRLVGEWVDGRWADELTPCQRANHEEWWVFDHENYGGFLAGECSPAEAQSIALAIERAESRGHDLDALAAWLANQGETITSWADDYDGFCPEGPFEDLEAFAYSHMLDMLGAAGLTRGQVDAIGPFLDASSWARSMENGGAFWTVRTPNGLYVFWQV